ncbi:hypothetical protein H2203_009103 [Taxawa tesnikishii (nom. ined.)]|nr:hypothetical protein H2203_009103 [Dothideales sp. JES 119]
MSEFIGSRISLISKSDIKYVGTLHEINSENSTVALENVKSYGTEGRRGNPDEEIPPNDQIYDYIVFRGSDVKDLTIVEAPKENKPPPPPVPNDPAILGAARPHPQGPPQQPGQPPNQQWRGPQPPFPSLRLSSPPQQHSRFAPPGGLHGFPGTPGAVPGYGMPPYGPPPGWYPPGQGPPGQGFPQGPPGPFSPQPPPIGPPGQQNQGGPQQAPIGSAPKQPTPSQTGAAQPPPPAAEDKPSELSTTPAPSSQAAPPPPPVESKPDVAEALAPPQQPAQTKPAGPKNNRIAVPLPSPRVSAPLQAKPGNAPATVAPPPTAVATTAAQQQQSATQAAAAAVAAAMAKLGPLPAQANKQAATPANAIDNLTKKVGEMRTDERIRNSRQPGTGGYAASHRGGRGGRRPSTREQGKPVEVPQADFDFESANAKFNKQDLVKEAIATGSPLDGATNGASAAHDDVVIPKAATYNKSTSFFDNISSELKDRQAAQDAGQRLGGNEFRSVERRKNLETFGQSNVDTGFRGGYRGRGRGRGFGGRGRGGPRGGYAGRGHGYSGVAQDAAPEA